MTNEIKTKAFAMYWPCDYIGEWTPSIKRRLRLESIEGLISSKVGQAKLILRTIDQLTDEECIKAYDTIGAHLSLSNESKVVQLKELFSSPNFWVKQTNISGNKWLMVCDYLRSIGIDLPNYHLDGKTLIEAGLAIRNESLTQKQK